MVVQTMGANPPHAIAHSDAAHLFRGCLADGYQAAIDMLRRTRSHEGRRRQLQYVGKLMRRADAQPLREAVAAQQLAPARETYALHEAERWRDRDGRRSQRRDDGVLLVGVLDV